MSINIDAYFCFCCLCTNELTSLSHGNPNKDKDYPSLLEDLFKIKLSQEDCNNDNYICEECSHRLVEMREFKTVVFDTMHALQLNGLIKLDLQDDFYLVENTVGSEKPLYTKSNADWDINVLHISENEQSDLSADENSIRSETKPTPRRSRKSSLKKLKDDSSLDEEFVVVKVEEDNEINVKDTGKRKRQTRSTRARKRQLKRVRKRETTAPLPEVQQDPTHICGSCGKGFETMDKLQGHTGCHKKGNYKCDKCEQVFNTYNGMKSHSHRRHSAHKTVSCPHPLCRALFATRAHLTRHLRAKHKHGAPDYKCSVCPQSFVLPSYLIAHMELMHPRDNHVCSKCGEAFYAEEELQEHVCLRPGDHPCQLCPEICKTNQKLIEHMRNFHNLYFDTREPFICEVCDKKFSFKFSLVKHIAKHGCVVTQDKEEVS